MKLHLGRIVILSTVSIFATAVFGACASSEEGLWPDSSDASQEAEASSFGGIGGGVGTGGFSGSGFGGTGAGGSGFGGTGTGGVVGTGGFGTGGGLATGGGPGTGGTGGGNTGTCNPAFCPNSGVGSPCCVNPNGPCGMNNGSGCSTVTADF